jgi:hypothetical protein
MSNKLKSIFLFFVVLINCFLLDEVSADDFFEEFEPKEIEQNIERDLNENLKSQELEKFQPVSLKAHLVMFAREPSFPEVQKQSLIYAAIPSHQEFKKYRTQARMRNLLPAMAIDYEGRRQFNNDFQSDRDYSAVYPNQAISSEFSGNPHTYNNNSLDNSLSNGWNNYRNRGWQASIEWNLQKVLYDDEITDLLSEQRRFASIRNDLIEQVHSVYFLRKRKILNLSLNPPINPEEKLIADLEVEELTARLDSLTGGWFSSMLRK